MAKKGHRAVRTCILCRERYFKDQLMRLVLWNNKIIIDHAQKMPGRGAYTCKDCLDLVKKNTKGCLNRAFKTRADLAFNQVVNQKI